MEFICKDIDDVLYKVGQSLLEAPEVPARQGVNTKELFGTRVVLKDPRARWITNKERKHNYVAQIAETIWVLSGNNDMEWLERFLPRCKEFSDNGKTWRAAYGPRLRKWPHSGGYFIDQIGAIQNELKKNPFTRQAVMSIWDPAQDPLSFGYTKDIPCNNWLHFIIRDNQLNCMVAIRSNDLIWGCTGINLFEFSVLQELLASILEIEVGELHFMQTSLHVYEHHYNRLENIVNCKDFDKSKDLYIEYEKGLTWLDFHELFDTLYKLEMDLRKEPSPIRADLSSMNLYTKKLASKLFELYESYPKLVSQMVIPLYYKRDYGLIKSLLGFDSQIGETN